jgi:hypothetical protein
VVNELRPHNSGHHTIDACVTSQYEQQVRALCGLPLGDRASTAPRSWSICSASCGMTAASPTAATASPTGRCSTPCPACACTSTPSTTPAMAARWATSR